MRTLVSICFAVFIGVAFNACDEISDDALDGAGSGDKSGFYSMDGAGSGGEGSGSGEGTGTGDGDGDGGEEAGLITAAEWNDLENWDFWNNLMNGQDYSDMPEYWEFFTNNRFSVVLNNGGNPVIDAKVELTRDGNTVWTARTDNTGKAELWSGLFQETTGIDAGDYSLKVNDQDLSDDLTLYADGVNELGTTITGTGSSRAEIAFIVDATGSMSDELEFLKEDLKDVIQQVEQQNRSLEISTAAVFYRDEGDDYVTRKSEFTSDLDKTVDFINDQSANGGGDFPEAVHDALEVGIGNLQWSGEARVRLAFLLLDAPPHYTANIKSDLHQSIEEAAGKGIRIIPITASGIDKETEFLMRFISIATNGTYVFITDDSGIGGDHLEASVGEYDVEYLNDLLVRLIFEYSE